MVPGPEEFRGNTATSRLELAPLNCTRTENARDERNPFCIRLFRLDAREVEFVRPGPGEVHFAKGQISTLQNPKRPCSTLEADSRNPEIESRPVYIRQWSTSEEPSYSDDAFCRLKHPS